MPGDAPWSVASREKTGGEYTLQQVRSLDVDAVRLCDGFEYRYHVGGAISFFSMRTKEELPVTMFNGLPEKHWWHLPVCGCPMCTG
jgi:hypothetical protein